VCGRTCTVSWYRSRLVNEKVSNDVTGMYIRDVARNQLPMAQASPLSMNRGGDDAFPVWSTR